MDPNIPAVVICLNEGGGITPGARWYEIRISEIEDYETIDALNKMFTPIKRESK